MGIRRERGKDSREYELIVFRPMSDEIERYLQVVKKYMLQSARARASEHASEIENEAYLRAIY